jgi:hypothetical protein
VADRARVKRANFEGDRARLATVEDKFVFSLEQMRQIGRDLVFSSVDLVDVPDGSTLGERTRLLITQVFTQLSADTAILDRYSFLFDDLTEAYARPLGVNERSGFGFFVFTV